MNLGKTVGIFALSAAILTSGCQVGQSPQELATIDQDRPTAELVVEDAYQPVHGAGFDAIQKQTDAAGIATWAPTEIAEQLSEPAVDGWQDQEMQTKNFSARFESPDGRSSYEVVCTDQGVGSGGFNGNGPLTVLDNGLVLQQTGPQSMASNWVKVGADSHCRVTSEGLSAAQTVHMSNSLQTFAPDFQGAYLVQ